MELDFNISFSSISGPYLVKEHKTPLVEGGKSLLFALAVVPLGRQCSKMGTDLRVRLLSREDNDPKLPKKPTQTHIQFPLLHTCTCTAAALLEN